MFELLPDTTFFTSIESELMHPLCSSPTDVKNVAISACLLALSRVFHFILNNVTETTKALDTETSKDGNDIPKEQH